MNVIDKYLSLLVECKTIYVRGKNVINDISLATIISKKNVPKIKAAITAAKNKRDVFNALENGWEGVALKNFEANFEKAIIEMEKTLARAFAALVKEIAAVTDAMVDQDIHMVERQ